MKLYQKILLAAVGLLLLAGLALPFVPIGEEYVGFDFNNGMFVQGKRYFGMFDSRTKYPSKIADQMRRLKMPEYPELYQDFATEKLILMRNPYMRRLPRGFDATLMKFEFGPNIVPKLSPQDVLEFRDEMLNKFGSKATIQKAIEQGAARGGYIADACYEQK